MFIVVALGFSYFIFVLNISLQVMITLGGGVLSVLGNLIFPVWIHLKCVFYDRSSGQIEGDDQWNASIEPNECKCEVVYGSKWALYGETVFLVGI